MKNIYLWMVVLAAVIGLSGCGSDTGDVYDHQADARRVYFLQTYDDVTGRYEGVEGVYYECGRDIVGYTDALGAFSFVDGDQCTFYDLDDRRSYEYDRLYLGSRSDGSYAVGDVPYSCASGWSGTTDTKGMFVFDPDYQDSRSDGDICRLSL